MKIFNIGEQVVDGEKEVIQRFEVIQLAARLADDFDDEMRDIRDFLTLINAALFYYYLTWRGRNHLRPQMDPKIVF